MIEERRREGEGKRGGKARERQRKEGGKKRERSGKDKGKKEERRGKGKGKKGQLFESMRRYWGQGFCLQSMYDLTWQGRLLALAGMLVLVALLPGIEVW